MKKSSKAHLVVRETPLLEGEPADTLCGQTFPQWQLVYVWDTQEMGQQMALSTLLFCRECCAHAHDSSVVDRRIVYGVVQPKPNSEGPTGA